VLALIVVKVLTHSPWGVFTVGVTVPITFFMSIYIRYIRPARIWEISMIGFVLLILAPRDYLSTFLKIGSTVGLLRIEVPCTARGGMQAKLR